MEGQGRRSRRREAVRSGPEEGWELPTKLSQCNSCSGEVSPGYPGVDSVPGVADLILRERVRAWVCKGPGGFEDPRFGRFGLERGTRPGE